MTIDNIDPVIVNGATVSNNTFATVNDMTIDNIDPVTVIGSTVENINPITAKELKGINTSLNDHISKDNTIEITDVEATSKWYYRYNEGNWVEGGVGTGTLVLDENTTYSSIDLKTIDKAGNESAITHVGAWTTDNIADDFTVSLSDDTYGGTGTDSDQITSNGRINVEGVTDLGSMWFYQTSLTGEWEQGTGTSFTLDEGVYSQVSIQSLDLAGNSSITIIGEVVVDKTADDFVASITDSGSKNYDHLTNQNYVNLTGVESTSKVYYSINGGAWTYSDTMGDNSRVELPGNATLNNIKIKTVDIAGNESNVTNLGNWITDTTPDAISANLRTDTVGGTGTAMDQISSDGIIDVSRLEGSSSWSYSVNGGSSWITGSGTSFELTSGTYSDVKVKSLDTAGNIYVNTMGRVVVDITPDYFSYNTVASTINTSGIESTSTLYINRYDGTWVYQGTGNVGITVEGGHHYAGEYKVKTVDIAGNETVQSIGAFVGGEPFTANNNSSDNRLSACGEAAANSTITYVFSGPSGRYSQSGTLSAHADGSWNFSKYLGGFSSGTFSVTFTGTGSDGVTRSYTISQTGHDPIAELEDGGFIVSWIADNSTDDRDEDGFGVFAQRYAQDGTKVGDSFLVNTHVSDNQTDSDVIGLNDGGFVIVWQSELQDGSGWGVYSQRYDVNSQKVGVETLVNTNTEGSQLSPEITSLNNGGYVIVWQSEEVNENGVYDIFVKVYDAAGVEVSSEAMVNTLNEDNQAMPQLTLLDDGNFIVVWQSFDTQTQTYEVSSQLFNENGSKIGAEVSITKDNLSDSSAPYVTALSNGGYVISWVNYSDESREIYTQTFDQSGVETSGETLIETFIGETGTPEVSGFNDGFVVALVEDGNLKIKTFSEDSEFIEEINIEKEVEIVEPHIVSLKDGGFLTTWTEVEENGNMKVIGQRFNNEANTEGEEFEVGQVTYDDSSIIVLDGEYADINFDDLAESYENINTIDALNGDYIIHDVTIEDVLKITDDSNDLIFIGDNGDKVDLLNNDEWEKSEDKKTLEDHDGEFVEYVHKNDPAAKLFIDEDISVI